MIIDSLFFIYCLLGALKGRRRKLADMLYRLVRNSSATLGGVSLYSWIGDLLRMILSNFLANSLGFILAFISSFLIIRKFKRTLTSWIEAKLEEAEQSRWGAILGFWTNFVMGSAAIIMACLSGEGVVHDTVSEESMVGRTFTLLLKGVTIFLNHIRDIA